MRKDEFLKNIAFLMVVFGMFLQLIYSQKYLNYSNEQRLDAIEKKIDILFQEQVVKLENNDKQKLDLIEQYSALSSDSESKMFVSDYSKSAGTFFLMIGILLFAIGEWIKERFRKQ